MAKNILWLCPASIFPHRFPHPKTFFPCDLPSWLEIHSKRRSLQSNIRLRDTPGGADRASAPPVLSSRMHHAPPPRARQTPLARGSAAATPGRTHACAAGRETNGQQHPSGPPQSRRRGWSSAGAGAVFRAAPGSRAERGVCVCARARACVCVCVRACVRACVCARAWGVREGRRDGGGFSSPRAGPSRCCRCRAHGRWHVVLPFSLPQT